MGYVLADRRDVGLFVADAANGVRVLTREPRQARAFQNPEKAREWASTHLLGVELEATVLRNRRATLSRNKSPAQAGQPGGAISSSRKANSEQHCTVPAPRGKD